MTARILCCTALVAGLAAAQVNFYSIDREIALGNQLAAEFRQRTKRVESAAALAYIDRIGQCLAKEIGGPSFTYRFALIADDPTPLHEAAAFPGGFLFVPASLILAAHDEDELAGMLAHSIAHVAGRDATRQATKAEIVDIAGAPLIYMGGRTGYAIQQGADLAIPLGMLQFWRRLELNADRSAARAMAAAGWDPAARARYIERVQLPDESSAGKMWAVLPQRSQRLHAIREVIDTLPSQNYGTHEGLAPIQDEVRRATLPK